MCKVPVVGEAKVIGNHSFLDKAKWYSIKGLIRIETYSKLIDGIDGRGKSFFNNTPSRYIRSLKIAVYL